MRERPTFCCYLITKAFALLTLSASSLLIVLRMYVLSGTSTFRDQPLIEVASIAIWNRNKVVMTLAIIIWGINAVVYVQCRLLLPCHDGDRELNSPHQYDWATVIARVKIQILFMSNHVLISSIVSLGAGTWPGYLYAGQRQNRST